MTARATGSSRGFGVARGTHDLAVTVTGDGPETLVLYHGLGSWQGTWREVVARLADRYRVVTFDQRGHGESTAPPGPWTMDDLAGDLAAVLDALGPGPVHLLGHSGGGVVAIAYALGHQEKIDRLILAHTASEANEAAAAGYLALADRAEEEGAAAVAGAFRLAESGTAPDPHAFAHAARVMATLARAPLTPGMGALHRPTLVLTATNDILGRGPQILADAIPGARLHSFEGLGHGSYLEAPDRFARVVSTFLTLDDPARLAAICQAFQASPFYGLLGLEASSDRAGAGRVRVRFDERLTSRYGGLHGGALMVVADAAVNVALATTFLEDEETGTVDLSMQFWAPAGRSDVVADATVSHRGGRLGFGECVLTANGRPVARAHGICRASRKTAKPRG